MLWNLGNAALQLGDDDRQQQFYSFALSRAREVGAATAVTYCLQRLCFGHWTRGDHVALRVSAEEAVALGTSIGQPAVTALPIAWLVLLAAQQDRDDYDDLLPRLEELVAAHPLGIMADPVHDLTRWAMGMRAASTGDASGAFHQLGRMRMPVLERLSATERIEAAVRAGEAATARAWTEDLAAFAEATRRPWALSAVAFGRALTADVDAELLFERALSDAASGGRPLDVARVELAYGEWLRRSQRRVDARIHLRRALETFHDVRAQWLASRAESGAARLGGDGAQARPLDPAAAHADGAQDRPARQLGHVQQGRGRAVLDLSAHGGLPPAQRLRQGRCHLARRAGPARPRLSRSLPCPTHPGHLAGVTVRPTDHSRPQCHHPPLREREVHEHRRPPPRPIERHEPREPTGHPGRPRLAGHRRWLPPPS